MLYSYDLILVYINQFCKNIVNLLLVVDDLVLNEGYKTGGVPVLPGRRLFVLTAN